MGRRGVVGLSLAIAVATACAAERAPDTQADPVADSPDDGSSDVVDTPFPIDEPVPASPDTTPETIIPQAAPSMFRQGARSDLALSAEGGLPLVEVRYLPVQTREDAWFVLGVDGRTHPVLFGRFRFQRYRDVLLECLVQSHAPVSAVIEARAEALLEGIAAATTAREVADLWEERTRVWEGGAAESVRPTLRALRGIPDAPLGPVAGDGTLRAIALEAMYYATVIDRMRVFDLFARLSTLGEDRALVRARTAAGQRIKTRRALTVTNLVELLRFAPADGSSPLTRARLPFLPARSIATLFPDLPDSVRARFGFDRRWLRAPFDTFREVQDVDATLTLLATLEHSLFAEIEPTQGCGEDSGADFVFEAAVAIEFRRYLGLLYAGYAADLLTEAPDLVIEAWDEHDASIDRAMVAAAANAAQQLESRLDLDIATCDRQHAAVLRAEIR